MGASATSHCASALSRSASPARIMPRVAPPSWRSASRRSKDGDAADADLRPRGAGVSGPLSCSAGSCKSGARRSVRQRAKTPHDRMIYPEVYIDRFENTGSEPTLLHEVIRLNPGARIIESRVLGPVFLNRLSQI